MESGVRDVNYHLTGLCNMNCQFCFAQFKDGMELRPEDSVILIQLLAKEGVKKINFVGGEPTIHPRLTHLLAEVKKHGLMTSIVSNGWNIDEEWLDANAKHLDWIGISVDSLDPDTNKKLGRCVKGEPLPVSSLIEILGKARALGLKIKINTVVTQLNKNELFHEFISEVRPEKWKIFQVLIVKGENDHAHSLAISHNEFERFLVNHRDLGDVTVIYPEYNEDMTGSYLIIDPSGRFVDNTGGEYRYSDGILDVGVTEALKQITISHEVFHRRHDPTRMNSIVTRVNEG